MHGGDRQLQDRRQDHQRGEGAFHRRHEELYTYAQRHSAVEVVNIESTLYGRVGFYDGGLGAGSAIDGPAIVEEVTTTLVIEPGWSAKLDKSGSYLIRRGRSYTAPETGSSQR